MPTTNAFIAATYKSVFCLLLYHQFFRISVPVQLNLKHFPSNYSRQWFAIISCDDNSLYILFYSFRLLFACTSFDRFVSIFEKFLYRIFGFCRYWRILSASKDFNLHSSRFSSCYSVLLCISHIVGGMYTIPPFWLLPLNDFYINDFP